MGQSHPLVDSHPYARRVRLRPAPPWVLWGTHHVNGYGIPLRHQRPRAAWAGYPSGWCPPDVRDALRELARGMRARGYDLACNCIGRDPEQDADFRGQGGKAAHQPGAYRAESVGWHLSGRAIDVTLPGTYNTGHAGRERMVADLLDVGIPLGWTPIAGEDWHVECRGPWAATAVRLESTRAAGLAALLDVGGWRGSRWEWRAVQAQLHRIGLNPGVIDGYPGDDTRAALEDAAGAPWGGEPSELLPALYDMEPAAALV